ncbi:MAG: DUF5658 family protein [Candidatus Spechtbacterales bacterium]|nr:DUF5658 family protein [Candidatus Spechtbacterales bacterium]
MKRKTLKIMIIHSILQFFDWLTTKTALTIPNTKAREFNPIAKWFTDRDKWGTLLALKAIVIIFTTLDATKKDGAELEKFHSSMKKMNWFYAFVVTNNARIIHKVIQKNKKEG